MLYKRFFSYFIMFFLLLSNCFFSNIALAADSTFVYCYGVKNSGAPLDSKTVKGAWAIDPNSIKSGVYGASWFSSGTKFHYGNFFTINGDWGNSNLISGTYGDGGWMNYFRLANDMTVKKQVIEACKKAFLYPNIVNSSNWYTSRSLNGPWYGDYKKAPFTESDLSNLTILPVASNGTFQYPIIENSKKLAFFSGLTKGINDSFENDKLPPSSQDLFNNENIYKFSLAANLAYSVPEIPLGAGVSSIRGEIPANYIPIQMMAPRDPQDPNNKYSYAVALKNDQEKIILIAYKGTDPTNAYDIRADIELMASNITNGSVLANYVQSAYNFYNGIKKNSEYKDYKIILTGHSLGGFIATQIAVRTGELARIFSSPSNFLTAKKFNIAASFASVGYLPLPNVINFARSWDPVVNLSQNPLRSTPVNSTVYYPARAGDPNVVNNHLLNYFIPEIFENYYKNMSSIYDPMSYLYLYPDTQMDYVSNYNINFAGSVNFN
jgi:hypothetical protein